MTFETMDWEKEAKRVAAAFSVEVECEFRLGGRKNIGMALHWRAHPEKKLLPTSSGNFTVAIKYSADTGFFYLKHIPTGQVTVMTMWWAGSCIVSDRGPASDYILAKHLFLLGLLTPEAKNALQVTISAHQKLEWTLEYDTRVGTTK